MANASAQVMRTCNPMEGTMPAPQRSYVGPPLRRIGDVFALLRLTTVAVAVGFLSLAGTRVAASNGACTTASDCQALLPKICMVGDDGLGRCAHWMWEEGKCGMRMCELPPPSELTGHWSGSETTSGGRGTLALSADVTSISAKEFTGMTTADRASVC